ncbi:uncharacterized protein LOC144132522 [Amblyomma americanum]
MSAPTSVRHLKTHFKRLGVDMRAPCTDAGFSDTLAGVEPPKRESSCWLINQVGIWNRFFQNVGVELNQNGPGKLSVRTFGSCCNPSFSDYGLVCATLLGELLAGHRCIYNVHLSYSGQMFGLKPGALANLIPNGAIEHFHVDGARMSSDEAHGLIRAMVRGQPASIEISNVKLRPCIATMLSNCVESTVTLKELSLVEVGLKVDDVMTLFKTLESSKTVECFKLEGNAVGVRGAQQLASVLKQNKTLRSATVQKAQLEAEGAIAIVSALAENTTLTVLRIASNYIGDVGTRALADALKINNTLLGLDLRDNAKGVQGGHAIAQMLAVNAKLEELHVCGNAISDSAVVAIAESILHNKALNALSIFANNIGEDGVTALARLLASNKTLWRLNATLKSTSGDTRPLDTFTNALASSKSLYAVQLFVWGSLAMKKLSHAVQLTKTLQYLCVRSYGTEIQQLCSALEANHSIQEVQIDSFIYIEDGTALARLIEKTKTLQAVTITKELSTLCVTRIFHGLAKNKSICLFSAQCVTLGMTTCTAIAATLEVNRTLCSITLGWSSFTDDCLSVISAGVAKNPVIQIMELTYMSYSNVGLKIKEHLRRNSSMMLQAVEFVLDHKVGRVEAEAFEMFKNNAFFRQQLSKAAISRGLSSPLPLLRETEHFIEDNYFRITGVVKQKVVCVRAVRKRKKVTMFDQLNEYCLKKVFSYLRVSDVRL